MSPPLLLDLLAPLLAKSHMALHSQPYVTNSLLFELFPANSSQIIIAGVIYGHVASKYIYVRIFRGTDRMHKRDFVAVGSWVAIALCLWIIAWIIASAIPVFSNLLSLITALFASWFTYGLSGIFWLYMNKGVWFSNWKKISLTMVNLLAVATGAVLCGMGLWVSGKALHDNPSSASFSCANNA
jgi:hypothetical protein